MSDQYVRNVLEAGLLAAGRPLSIADLGQLFEEHSRPDAAAVRAALAALGTEYADRGIELKETASGYRVQVRSAFAAEVAKLWPERPQRYSRALLETLALIAYRQPITRAEIESVRGVVVNPNILRTLTERNWIRVVGHRDVPGHPELLGTTREFLDYFGLRSLDELPPLAELKSMADVALQLNLPALGEGGEGRAGTSGADGSEERAAVRVALTGDAAAASDEESDEDERSASGDQAPELVAAKRFPDEP